MKDLVSIPDFEDYMVSKSGHVYSLHSDRQLKTDYKYGYHNVFLYDANGTKRTKRVHRLVAEAHIGSIKNNEVVNHIDGNKSNNCLSNLEICTKSENSIHSHRLGNTAIGLKPKKAVDSFDDSLTMSWLAFVMSGGKLKEKLSFNYEEWIGVPGIEKYFQVSSCGRIRSINRFVETKKSGYMMSGKVLNQTLDKDGYLACCLRINGAIKRHFVHRMVAAAFIQRIPFDMVVDHIDGNKSNNKIENLDIVSKSENISRAKRAN